ncbi:MAG: 50S ribosomal protein L23 [bacterium]|nr:50S ribosomal protein L23 [bacterium]
MKLFGSRKKKEEKEAGSLKVEAGRKETSSSNLQPSTSRAGVSLASVLVRPRITEKAANMTSANVYTFDITASATKKQVIEAVRAFYKVTPVKVHVVNTPAKRVRMRKKRGFGKTAASRKAYVFLKKGQEIQLT